MKHISRNLEETQKIAFDFVRSIKTNDKGATVVGLYGDLGSGKTTFVQNIAKVFGIGDTVTSPTFVIMKIYELKHIVASSKHLGEFKHLIHIDAYRLEKSEELLHLGWNELISDKNNLILVEWPEKVENIMPEHIKISLKTPEDEQSRSIDIIYN